MALLLFVILALVLLLFVLLPLLLPAGVRLWPVAAAGIYSMLGESFVQCFEHVKGVGLLEQARALAVESGDRDILGNVCVSLGNFR